VAQLGSPSDLPDNSHIGRARKDAARANFSAHKHRRDIEEFLEEMSAAVTAGDGKGTAELWTVPALIVSDGAIMSVTSLDEVARFFGSAKEQYNAQGVVDTRPEILLEEWVTPKIVIIDVRWPWLDARGDEVASESSTYTLRRDDKDELKLCVAVMHGASVPVS